jgi:hypothetical protein
MENETELGGERAGLAWGQNGEPIELPADAAGWRVRRHRLGDRGGPPEMVYHRGRPMILPLTATADDLLSQVGAKPGRYRLDPVDELGRAVKATAAYAVIEPGQTAGPTELAPVEPDVSGRLLATLEQVTRTQAEVMTAMIAQLSQVLTAAGGLLVPAARHRNGIIEIVQPTAPVDGVPPTTDWAALASALGPMLPQILANVGHWWRGGQGPAPTDPTTGGAS